MEQMETGNPTQPSKQKPRAAAKAKAAPKVKAVALKYFAPEANTVAVAGDFNHWDAQARMLQRVQAGWWQTTLELAPGRYHYRFVVDGEQWSDDPENPDKEPNEFASYNSILEVR